MSVSFNKSGIVEVSGTNSSILVKLVDESGNDLTDQFGNYLVSNASYDKLGYSHGFIEGVGIMSVYENVITTREFIEW